MKQDKYTKEHKKIRFMFKLLNACRNVKEVKGQSPRPKGWGLNREV